MHCKQCRKLLSYTHLLDGLHQNIGSTDSASKDNSFYHPDLTGKKGCKPPPNGLHCNRCMMALTAVAAAKKLADVVVGEISVDFG